MSKLKAYIDNINDFPKPGVNFYDISPLLLQHFTPTVEQLDSLFTTKEWQEIDAVAGVDARGFLFASALAHHRRKSLTIIRKGGKLPPPVISLAYKLEYGNGILEIKPGRGNIIIIDDVLATGGTLNAASQLCERAGYNVNGIATVIKLPFLNNFKWKGNNIRSLIEYDS